MRQMLILAVARLIILVGAAPVSAAPAGPSACTTIPELQGLGATSP